MLVCVSSTPNYVPVYPRTPPRRAGKIAVPVLHLNVKGESSTPFPHRARRTITQRVAPTPRRSKTFIRCACMCVCVCARVCACACVCVRVYARACVLPNGGISWPFAWPDAHRQMQPKAPTRTRTQTPTHLNYTRPHRPFPQLVNAYGQQYELDLNTAYSAARGTAPVHFLYFPRAVG